MVLITIDKRFLMRDDDLPPTVPPHLKERSWLEYERSVALGTFDDLARSLMRLKKSKSKSQNAKLVHDTRVTLRRWEAVWFVLEKHGWNEEKYWRQVGRKLRRLHKLLGNLRDWDVNIETAEFYGLPQPVIQRFKKERDRAGKSVTARLSHINMKKLLKRMAAFLHERPLAMALEEKNTEMLARCAYVRLEPVLREQEETTGALDAHAKTIEEMHELRLSIKAWRYVLADYFGLTNLQLVKAQQMLGKLNDLNRLLSLLKKASIAKSITLDKVTAMMHEENRLLKDFQSFRSALPYGLRPSVSVSSYRSEEADLNEDESPSEDANRSEDAN